MSYIKYNKDNGIYVKLFDIKTKLFYEEKLKFNNNILNGPDDNNVLFSQDANDEFTIIPGPNQTLSKITMTDNNDNKGEIFFDQDTLFFDKVLNVNKIVSSGDILASNLLATNKTDLENKLEKTGGIMTGDLNSSYEFFIQNNKITFQNDFSIQNINDELIIKNSNTNFFSFNLDQKPSTLILNDTIQQYNNIHIETNKPIIIDSGNSSKINYAYDENITNSGCFYSLGSNWQSTLDLGTLNTDNTGQLNIKIANDYGGFDTKLQIDSSNTIISNNFKINNNSFNIANKVISTDGNNLFFDNKELLTFNNLPSYYPKIQEKIFPNSYLNICVCKVNNKLYFINFLDNVIRGYLFEKSDINNFITNDFTKANITELGGLDPYLSHQSSYISWSEKSNYGLFGSIWTDQNNYNQLCICKVSLDNSTGGLKFDTNVSIVITLQNNSSIISLAHSNNYSKEDIWYCCYVTIDNNIYFFPIIVNLETNDISVGNTNDGKTGIVLEDIDIYTTNNQDLPYLQLESVPNSNSGVILSFITKTSETSETLVIKLNYIYLEFSSVSDFTNFVPTIHYIKNIILDSFRETGDYDYSPYVYFEIKNNDKPKIYTANYENKNHDIDIFSTIFNFNNNLYYQNLFNNKNISTSSSLTNNSISYQINNSNIDLLGNDIDTINDLKIWFSSYSFTESDNLKYANMTFIKKLNKYFLYFIGNNHIYFVILNYDFKPIELKNTHDIYGFNKIQNYSIINKTNYGITNNYFIVKPVVSEDTVYLCSHNIVIVFKNLNYFL